MRARFRRIPEYISTSLWFLPGIMVAGAFFLALATTALDIRLDQLPEGRQIQIAFTGSAEGARAILTTIAGPMLTITGVVFSITMLVLQMASSQFSPRTLRTFLRDIPSKLALGTFLGTFLFSVVALRGVRSEAAPEGEFVPGVTVTTALLLVVASIALLVYFIHHVASKIRVTSIVAGIGDETLHLIEHVLPERDAEDPPQSDQPLPEMPTTIGSLHTGVVVSIDVARLVDVARDEGLCVAVVPRVGDFVPKDSPLLRVTRDVGERTERVLVDAVSVATERTMEQDLTFGLRQLTDIALRALSPSTNDPTTAIDVVHAEHDLLRRIGARHDAPSVHRDDSGEVRLVVSLPTWEDQLRMVFEEIGAAGHAFPRVRAALSEAADDLLRYLPSDRVAGIRDVASEWLHPSPR